MSEQKEKVSKGYRVVLDGRTIIVPLDSNKSWLTLFYSLPKEFVEKAPAYFEIPRCPYEVLRTDKYDDMINDDMFLLLVWDCYAWSIWQFFQVPRKDGSYGDIPGSIDAFSGFSPFYNLAYRAVALMRNTFEVSGLSFQSLYNMPPGMEVPWRTYQEFSNLVGNATDMIVEEQNWQPVLDTAWENLCEEDFDYRGSRAKTDFKRKWTHSRTKAKAPLSLEQLKEESLGDDALFDIADPRAEFEESALSDMQIGQFTAGLSDKDMEILRMRAEGYTLKEIAKATGYKNHSGVQKRIHVIAENYENFAEGKYNDYLDS